VETNQPGHPSSSNQTLFTRIGWAVLIIATLYVCYFSHLGAIGFVGPDEPRYAWIARDMAETGDWVTPRLYGKPWFEKPPLFYWGAALSFELFGVSEAAARLPSAVSALLATLALAWLALRLYGAETARWLLLFLPSTVGMIGFSHAAATDMLFSAMLTIAMVAAAVVVRLDRERNGNIVGGATTGAALPPPSEQADSSTTPWLALVLFGFFLGLAVLAKGPAGIILCGGSVFLWALFTKSWRDAFRLLHPAAIATFCVTALPWYILCARRNPDFFHVFIIEHNFKRYLTPEFQHIQPFWYYIPIVLIATFPWMALFIGLTKYLQSSRKTGGLSPARLFLLSWPIFTLLFFSLSKSKLPGYILPAIPALALLFAETIRYICRYERDSVRSIATGVGLGLSSTTLLGAFGIVAGRALLNRYGMLPYLSRNPSNHLSVILYLCGAVAAVAGLPVLVLWYRRRERVAVFFSFAVFLLALILFFANSRTVDEMTSLRPALVEAQAKWRPLTIENVKTYKLQRSFQYSLNFYLRGEARELSVTDSKDVVIFTESRNVLSLEEAGFPCSSDVVTKAVVVCRSSP
jgi:4-amino-4-deoxy-L-arabinose transferase-like glycosyltransferase